MRPAPLEDRSGVSSSGGSRLYRPSAPSISSDSTATRPPRLTAPARSRSLERKWRSEASRKERNRPRAGSAACRDSASPACARRTLRQVLRLVGIEAPAPDEDIERVPVSSQRSASACAASRVWSWPAASTWLHRVVANRRPPARGPRSGPHAARPGRHLGAGIIRSSPLKNSAAVAGRPAGSMARTWQKNRCRGHRARIRAPGRPRRAAPRRQRGRAGAAGTGCDPVSSSHDHGQGPEVPARRRRFAPQLLGRHVVRRAEQDAGPGSRPATPAGRPLSLGDAEIQHLRRFDAVRRRRGTRSRASGRGAPALAVRRLHRAAHTAQDVEHPRRPSRPLAPSSSRSVRPCSRSITRNARRSRMHRRSRGS